MSVFNLTDNLETTSEQLLCKESLPYFTTNYFFPLNSTPLFRCTPNRMQVSLFQSVCDNRFTLIKKQRQTGATTALVACALWYVLSGKRVIVLTHNNGTKTLFKEKLDSAYASLKSKLKLPSAHCTKSAYSFTNGAVIYMDIAKISGEVDMILVDEAMFISDLSDKMRSIKQHDDCKVVAVSSSNSNCEAASWFKFAWEFGLPGTSVVSRFDFESL